MAKRYTQPKAGTPDAMKITPSKLTNEKSNPFYIQLQNIYENNKKYYRGNLDDKEWQV